MSDYDVVVIGGGSGGLVAALVAKELGARVALIDRERLGGECLYAGCVPSKTLIHIARVAHLVRQGEQLGVLSSAKGVAMPRVAATIAGVIDTVGEFEQSYVAGVDVRFGKAIFRDARTLTLDGASITARSFIIATGSRPAIPDIADLDANFGYLTNDSVFALDRLPQSLVVLGGGPVGCELAQAFARLGSAVTIVQRAARLLPREEPEVSAAIHSALASEGIEIILGARVTSARRQGDLRGVTYDFADGASGFAWGSDLLVAAGRVPNVVDLGLAAAGVAHTARGITVDERLRTSAPRIFAIGDVIGGYAFTHVAAEQGKIAARNAIFPGRLQARVDLSVVPWVTFTDPQAARVGLTEADARARHGAGVRAQTLPWARIDRAQTESAPAGFIKLVIDGKGTIYGAHLVGAGAGELLGEIALAMRNGLRLDAVGKTIHPYPTLSTGLSQIAGDFGLGERLDGARRLARLMMRK